MSEPNSEPTPRDPLDPQDQEAIERFRRRKAEGKMGPGIPSARIHEVPLQVEQLDPADPLGPEKTRKLFAELKG